ncbi:NAD(P)/FAD-dependent oxidoreductase [uncultured Shewanella sp.]|uniref:NAD(P)/FAD-dependent oxidoreductase n=1 Tax=uncultured Shewanella sp. TaxID=173975 RepID=UPI002604F6BE|nr:NAD(P)/FAD-dependent oxidoreductase [uncultured Shewanella sp.]
MPTDKAVQNTFETDASESVDVAIIGAGPSGSIAASLLHAQGKKVLVLEKQYFPRFSIGESLLPCCMTVIDEANMLEAVNRAGFQFKNGAAFKYRESYTTFDFTDKFTQGPGTTFQVERAKFDKLLADEAVKQGVDIRYGHTVESIDLSADPRLKVINDKDESQCIEAKFVLDASGFGRVLPKLLDLEKPSTLPTRSAVFNHVRDNITDPSFDRNKILISVHPDNQDIWYWLIPFSDGRCSVGVVGEPYQLDGLHDGIDCDLDSILKTMINQEPGLKKLLANAELINDSGLLKGYSANVKTLATDKFALLGNAGEFLDPVFSSGVTIAMQSASMAASTLVRQLNGESVDWQQDYAKPLMKGVDTFRTYVEAWYDCRFQDAIFFEDPDPKIKQMICSILAGYAWDEKNPFVSESKRRLNMVVELCRD